MMTQSERLPEYVYLWALHLCMRLVAALQAAKSIPGIYHGGAMACCNVCPSGLEMMTAYLTRSCLVNARFEINNVRFKQLLLNHFCGSSWSRLTATQMIVRTSTRNIVVTQTVTHPMNELCPCIILDSVNNHADDCSDTHTQYCCNTNHHPS